MRACKYRISRIPKYAMKCSCCKIILRYVQGSTGYTKVIKLNN